MVQNRLDFDQIQDRNYFSTLNKIDLFQKRVQFKSSNRTNRQIRVITKRAIGLPIAFLRNSATKKKDNGSNLRLTLLSERADEYINYANKFSNTGKLTSFANYVLVNQVKTFFSQSFFNFFFSKKLSESLAFPSLLLMLNDASF